jgi:lysozyme
MTYSKAAMFRQLVRHEGLRLKPYADTVGKITIGVGRNLTDNGISELEAEGLCIRDMADVDNDLDRNIAWWREMTPDRQMVFVDMCFNLGWPRFSRFRFMLASAEEGDYATAAAEMLNSRWAQQVGTRAEVLATMMRNG